VKHVVTIEPAHTSERDPLVCEASPPRRGSLPEVRIVVIYFIAASLWIVGSDLALTQSAVDEAKAGFIQTLKSLNFVITTAILLFLVLRHAYSGWRRAELERMTVIDQAREKFRKLSSHVQSLREKDRTWVAREIHDELGQLLTGIQMQLRLIESRLEEREDRALNPIIDKLVETSNLVDTTIASVQRISAGLRPSALDHLGLAAALTEEAELFSSRTGIPCSISITDVPPALPPEVSTAVFRIFQEALTNVARHAEARKVDAALSVSDGVLMLVVHDDGKGIDPSAVEAPRSLGLIGMLERAENVGGHVVFARHSKKGTVVTLTLPLPANSNLDLLHENPDY
jgi:signal transduction histidine kinase